jgi:exodeoxyribonuclease V gamma subunit
LGESFIALRSKNPVKSVIVGSDAVCQIPLLTKSEAEHYLKELLEQWQAGLQQPLPIAVRAAFAYLPKLELEKAKSVYEGGFNISGELDRDAYLQRFFPNFDALISSTKFEEWAEDLYRPMLTHITEVAQ